MLEIEKILWAIKYLQIFLQHAALFKREKTREKEQVYRTR